VAVVDGQPDKAGPLEGVLVASIDAASPSKTLEQVSGMLSGSGTFVPHGCGL
jgi:hypothetical protein